MIGRAAASLACLAVLVAGCAEAVPVGDAPAGPQRSSGPVDVHLAWESCAAAGADGGDPVGSQGTLAAPLLGDDFVPVAAVICRSGPQPRPAGGSELVAVEERADDVTTLVAALRLPDAERTDGPCTADLPFVPWLALLDARGRWINPGVPTDACGKPRQEFRAAYDQLRTERVATRVLRELESDEAVASGCAQQWADMVWVTGEFGGGQGSAPVALPPADAEVRVCVYQVPVSERGGGKPAGEFESGGTLPGRTWAAIRRELTATAPAATCDSPASRFAVLHPPTGNIYVEADGCRRALIETGTGPSALRHGSTDLIDLVFDR
ncbi:hypothetical protein [Micromonospora sp. C95]|uniref:hypothetical protein n=1 Tax=Micromonospora sp. C95 TaxID=2824882 RepID=UPI001B36FF2E|nr:hypothetical protein [Micromonospora sp. C95]MBQ1025387.1 hypothetical protein [Micromonospora sp. C95]